MLNFSCPWTWSQSLCKEHSCLFYVILFFRREHNCKRNHRKMWALAGKFFVYFWTSLTKSMRKTLCYTYSFSLLFPIWHIIAFLFLIWEFHFFWYKFQYHFEKLGEDNRTNVNSGVESLVLDCYCSLDKNSLKPKSLIITRKNTNICSLSFLCEGCKKLLRWKEVLRTAEIILSRIWQT